MASNPRVIVTPTQPGTYTANLVPSLSAPPGNYAVTQIATNSTYVRGINNYGQVAGSNPLFLWTPVTPNATVGNMADIGGQDRTWQVSGAAGSLTASAVSPPHGNGSNAALTFTFADTKGWQDLGVVDILVNAALDGRSACYLAYSRPANMLYLVDDTGSTLLPGLSNSQCAIDPRSVSVSGNGNSLTLALSLTLLPKFTGNQVIYMAARDSGEVNTSGWQAMGTWTVP